MFKRKIKSLVKENNPEKGMQKIMDAINAKCVFGSNLEVLNDAERTVYFNYIFSAEIEAGGFAMLFFHPAGAYVFEILTSLETIGALKCAQLLREAIAFFPSEVKGSTLSKRQDMLEEIDPDDTLFLELNEALTTMGEPLDVYQKAYMLKHIDEFDAKL